MKWKKMGTDPITSFQHPISRAGRGGGGVKIEKNCEAKWAWCELEKKRKRKKKPPALRVNPSEFGNGKKKKYHRGEFFSSFI